MHAPVTKSMDRRICGAIRKKGAGICQNPAGKGTDHVGEGRCKFHGGASPRKHGAYSGVTSVRLRELMAEIDQGGVPLDVTKELLVARALLYDWLNQYDALTAALLAWNETRDPEQRPATVPDVFEARALIETISRVVSRIERGQSDQYIPRGKLFQLMQAMGRVVDSKVTEEVATAIHEDWLRIQLP